MKEELSLEKAIESDGVARLKEAGLLNDFTVAHAERDELRLRSIPTAGSGLQARCLSKYVGNRKNAPVCHSHTHVAQGYPTLEGRMRKLILQEFVTLDGMAAQSDGGTEFIPATFQGDDGFQGGQEKLIESANTMVLGRKTYEMFSEYWPNVKEGQEKEFADKLNSMAKFVVSSTLETAPWGDWEPAKVVSGRAEEEIAKLKQQPGNDMVIWGSISLSQSLINAGLIDEIRLVTCPLVLGEGRPFFADRIGSLDLKLKDAKTFNSGAVEIRYVPGETAESDKARRANR